MASPTSVTATFYKAKWSECKCSSPISLASADPPSSDNASGDPTTSDIALADLVPIYPLLRTVTDDPAHKGPPPDTPDPPPAGTPSGLIAAKPAA